ncbi:MAG: ABC transporter ATP-binding protein/permease [Oscillospiraceae bacterium]|nr:ABC transporter ATP-binding protein/permease [Oscillospiraceae bacterium]
MSKNKKKDDKFSFGKAMKITLRGYGIWWKVNPKILLSPLFCAVVDGLSPYVGIYLSARIINELAGTRDAHTLTILVLAALISAAVLTMSSVGLHRWQNCQDRSWWYLHEKIISDKLLSLDFDKIDDPHTHDLLSRITQNVQSVGWGLPKLIWSLGPIVKTVMTVIGAITLTISLFTLSVPAGNRLTILNNPLFIALIIAVMLVITFIAPVLSNKAGIYWYKYTETIKTGDRFFGFFMGRMSEHSRSLDVRMYRQDIFTQSVSAKQDYVQPDSLIAKWAKGRMGGLYALSGAVTQIFTGAAYIFVCLKALGGAFGIGSITQYIASITALSGGISALISNIGDLRNNAPFLKTTFEFLDIPNAMYQGSLTTEKRSDKKYEIEFRNVGFKYLSSEDYALRNVSLKFNIGQRLAVVGQNGSGKTTFIKLLCRLYDPTEGEILLNGIDIRKYDYLQYMDIFSVVFQDFKLLSFSLGQNIAAAAKYNSGKAADCLIKVGFGERLRTMSKSLETCLYKDFEEDGVEISGGEVQKIALARALYKDAPFIILDEPTAALDPIAEFEVYSKMDEIAGDKTAVFISHRLSSCRFCQDIAVFHEGKLIQRGSHDALISDENGKYHELWNAQAQYYQENNETDNINAAIGI